MTIVAGFKFNNGVVLCADTQETYGSAKRQVPKLRFEEVSSALAAYRGWLEISVAFCAAADSGPFADKVIDLAWRSAKTASSLDDASIAVEESIKKTYRDFGKIYQRGCVPFAELIYGIKASGESRLFSAYGPVVNEVSEYRTAGLGAYLADFLAERMHRHVLTANQCIILAAYILHQTKEHVDGCGGESHIAILRHDDASGVINRSVTQAITENVAQADLEMGKVLLSLVDLDLTDEAVEKEVAHAIDFLNLLRDEQKADIKKWEQFKGLLFGMLDTDSYGLVKQSAAQKSAGPP